MINFLASPYLLMFFVTVYTSSYWLNIHIQKCITRSKKTTQAEILRKSTGIKFTPLNLIRAYIFNLPPQKVVKIVYRVKVNNKNWLRLEIIDLIPENEEIIYKLLRITTEVAEVVYIERCGFVFSRILDGLE